MKILLITSLLMLVGCKSMAFKPIGVDKKCYKVCSEFDRTCRNIDWDDNFCLVD